MSDRDDQDKKGGREYSVDEILAEYGSGKYNKPKVVEFPPQEQLDALKQTARFRAIQKQQTGHIPTVQKRQTGHIPAVQKQQTDGAPTASAPAPEKPRKSAKAPEPQKKSQKKSSRKAEDSGENIIGIEPESPIRGLAARISTMRRRADHYADHMYDQAEPDEETRKVEKYLPGVDQEETPKAARRAVKRKKPPRPAPPDTPLRELTARYAKGLRSKKVRSVLAVLCAVLCAAASILDPAALGLPEATSSGMPIETVRQFVLLGLLVLTGALCAEVIGKGLWRFRSLRLGQDTLLALAFLATVGDSALRLTHQSGEGLPCCAVTAFGLAFGLWGACAHRQGDRLSSRAAAQVKEPFVVTVDEGKWSGRPVYAKWLGSQIGVSSQIQSEDAVQRAYTAAAPVLLTACLVCSVLAAAAGGGWPRFLWCASATLTAASAWTAPLAYSFPYRKLARRLFSAGAALAGWPGVSRCRGAGILMGDNDLFPTGTVRPSGIRIFGNFSNEKVVAYTATLLRVLDCGLTRPFHDLLRSQGAFYRECSQVRYHEGGVTGAIRNQEVFVGTAAFMHLMDVEMPQGLNVKHAIFCAIDGELAGIFTLRYDLGQSVKPCLAALMQAGASPILVTRDPNLIPALMREKFKLPVERMEFPPVNRRLELSDPEQEHDKTPVALLGREGLSPYCDAVVGGRRLRAAARWGIAFALAGSILGVALTFYLTYLGAASSLTPVNFLLYMALWLVPAVILNHWAGRF